MKIKSELKPIEVVAGWKYPQATRTYFSYYGLDFENRIVGTEHLFGTFDSGKYTLTAHIFKPAKCKGTITLLHGYLNHSGQYRHLVDHLLRKNYAVAVYDLPGHGLSTGSRAEISDFNEYTKSLTDFQSIVEHLSAGPYHLLGFSMGGAVTIDFLLSDNGDNYDKVILAAPLVRSAAWKASKSGFALYGKFADSVPRAHRKNSSDIAFLEFNKNKDVLHCEKVPLKWVKSLYEWNDRIRQKKPTDRKVYVIQGDKDSTVDYKYNLGFLEKLFPNVKTDMIEGARHELFNESADIRNEALKKVTDYLYGNSIDKTNRIEDRKV